MENEFTLVDNICPKPIYPEVHCVIREGLVGVGKYSNCLDGVEIELETYVRKKHTDGLYYLTHFKKKSIITKQEQLITDTLIIQNRFHHEIYNYIILGIIDPNLTLDNVEQSIAFTLDPDQTPEEERLRKSLDV